MEDKKYALVGLNIEGENDKTLMLMKKAHLDMIFSGIPLAEKNENLGMIEFASCDTKVSLMGQMVELLDSDTQLYHVMDLNKAVFLNRITSFEVKPYLVTVDPHGYLAKAQD